MGGASGSIKKSCAHRLIFTNSGGHLSSSVRVIPTSSFVFFFVLPMLCCKLSYSNIACADSAESLQLTMTEVLKRQCSKSKKGYKQVRVILNVLTLPLKQPPFPSSHFFSLRQHISVSEVKVDKMQVNGRDPGTTFAVCLDQDEKKFIQSVTRYKTKHHL